MMSSAQMKGGRPCSQKTPATQKKPAASPIARGINARFANVWFLFRALNELVITVFIHPNYAATA
jgi:hypothetical protein